MKKAFTLIELLLAIVIVGIGVSALPAIAAVSAKANAQSILSEVVTSTRIFIDDILLEPWNNKLAEGFVGADGATLYSGILKTGSDDKRFECVNNSNNESETKCYFNRHLAISYKTETDEGGKTKFKYVEANDKADNSENCSGVNCKNGATTELKVGEGETNFKNAFEIKIDTLVQYANIDETISGNTITAVFSTAKATGTSNALMVRTTTTPLKNTEIVEDISEVSLTSFTFNIGSEPR